MPRRIQYTINTVDLNVREKGGDNKEKLTTKGAQRAEIAKAPWWRSGPLILVLLLHMFFYYVL